MDTLITIRPVEPADASGWESLRRELWPDGAEDHATEIALFFEGHPFKDLTAALLAEGRSGANVGLVELSVRDDLPGLEGNRIGYVEGLYIRPEARHTGLARRFLRAARNWAQDRGCVAFASDRADRVIVERRFVSRE